MWAHRHPQVLLASAETVFGLMPTHVLKQVGLRLVCGRLQAVAAAEARDGE